MVEKNSVVLEIQNGKIEMGAPEVVLKQRHVLGIDNSVIGQASRFRIKVTAEPGDSTLKIGGKV